MDEEVNEENNKEVKWIFQLQMLSEQTQFSLQMGSGPGRRGDNKRHLNSQNELWYLLIQKGEK